MTFEAIEQEVRTLVNDAEAPYRFAQEDIWRFIVNAVEHLRNIKPSERYGENGLIDDSLPTPSANAEIRFSKKYEEAIVAYVGFRIYQLDTTDTANMQVAENLKARAETLMQL